MSDKFDSLWTILNKLDRKEKVTARSLADDLEVSERSIYRYITTLQVAGFPIDYDRIQGRYVFSEGFNLKKASLSLEETLAFALARKLLGNCGLGMERVLTSIEDKISAKRPADYKHILLSAEPIPEESQHYLGLIHQAIINYQRIKIVYKAFHAKKPTESKVDPYYLFFRERIWYLRGHYHLVKAVRTFAFDRIVSLSLLDEFFVPPHISPEDELSGAFGAFIDGKPVDVVLRFDEFSRPLVLRKKWHKSQQVRELEDGKIEVRFTVNGLLGIQRWIYQWIPHVEVIEPEEFRSTLKAELLEAIKLHSG